MNLAINSSIESGAELVSLLAILARRYDYDLHHYGTELLARRARMAMFHEGASTLTELARRVDDDSRCARRVVSILAVHATAMFRDPQLYTTFRERVAPNFRARPVVRIWHAGCSTGEEVYSLAIVLAEEGLYDRCRIYATDIGSDLLERARTGRFPLAAMRKYTEGYQRAGGRRSFSRYFTTDSESATFSKELAANVTFARHNLATHNGFDTFDAIFCRNVLIYFRPLLKNRAHARLFKSLASTGVLALGHRESVHFTPHANAYQEFVKGVRLFRKVG